MKITKAIRMASAQKRGITRKSWGPNPMWIIPTNTTVCMLMMEGDKVSSIQWSPSESDLTATDWTVYG